MTKHQSIAIVNECLDEIPTRNPLARVSNPHSPPYKASALTNQQPGQPKFDKQRSRPCFVVSTRAHTNMRWSKAWQILRE